jgi:hypothetical protein
VHTEGLGAICNELADATEADDRQCLVGELDALPPRALPSTGGQRGVRLRDVARLGQQQRHRVFGCGDDVALRCVDDHHPATRGRGDIDVVEADPGTTDHQQRVGLVQDVGGDLCCRADDQRLCTSDVVGQLVEVEPHIDHMARSTQAIEAAIGDFFCDKDPRHCHHRYRPGRGFERI